MTQKRHGLFKTVVLSKSQLTDILEIFLPFFVFIFVVFCINIDFTGSMDIFFQNGKAYANVCTLGNETERTKKILESYYGIDYSAGKKENTLIPEIKTYEEIKVTEKNMVSEKKVNNQTNINLDLAKFTEKPLYFKAEQKEPSVLIIHTHTTESYHDRDRDVNDENNMIKIGKTVKEKLEESGIKVIHDTTVHDYPSYNGAYTRSLATVTKQLEKNPDINIILDLHRDAVSTEDGSKISMNCEIDGVKTAQIMFVVGTNAQLTHDSWEENLNLAIKLQEKADEMYKGFTRPVNLRKQRFNQQLSKGSIIVEIGSNGNTIEEAKRAGERFSEVLIEVLKS